MTVDVYEDLNGEYRWCFLSANGKVIADSGESYKRPKALQRALSRIFNSICAGQVKFRFNGKAMPSHLRGFT